MSPESLLRKIILSLILILLCGKLAARDFDLILLMDESGSMLKTDPRGHRKDAANLFLRLCDDSHVVGAMGFATDVRVLSEPMPVSPSNRDFLVRQIEMIKSRGLFTDIEKGLELALRELPRRSPDSRRRAVLLMTDGEVDLSDGDDSREILTSIANIRGSVVSRYQQEGVELYCVAFSSGADLKLLNYIAEATGGMCVQGTRDDELQRLFLRLFEEISQPQTIPIIDDSVLIDSSVREATFLITHDLNEGERVRLVPPGESPVSRRAAEADPSFRWFSAPRYELITISEPKPGKWNILPQSRSPQDRVIILADMELQLSNFEPVARAGESRWLLAELKSQGKTVTAPQILNRLEMTVTLSGSRRVEFPLWDDGQHGDGSAGDGLFGAQFRAPNAFGPYDLEIIARAPTIERRIVRNLNVVDRWFQIQIEKEVVSPGDVIPLKVLSEADAVTNQVAQPEFTATILSPDASRVSLEIPAVRSNLHMLSFDETGIMGNYRLTVTGVLRDARGNVIARDTIGPLNFIVKSSTSSHIVPPIAEHTPEPAPERTAEPTPQATPEEHHAQATPEQHGGAGTMDEGEPQDSGIGGLSIIIQILIVLILLFIAGALGFLVFKRRAPGYEAQSMAPLRQRASQIREESYSASADGGGRKRRDSQGDMDDQLDALIGGEESGEGLEDSEDLIPEPTSEEEPSQLPGVDESGETEEVEADIEQVAEAETVVGEMPPEAEEESEEASGPALDDDEQNLLAEIMGESAESEEAEDAAEEEEAVPEEDEVLQDTGETEVTSEATEPEMEATAGESESDENMSSEEADLLAEIMGEQDAVQEETAATENTAENSDEGEMSSDEADLLSEIMGEVASDEDSGQGSPKIPEEADNKSEQDAIDDILKQIEGLME
ncbi:MAG: VWA domain-containing protein [Candidatus Sumerlaeia bacterium]